CTSPDRAHAGSDTLSLHDALPISPSKWRKARFGSVKTACSAEARHDLAREQLHRAPHALLGQAAEVHPAEHLADAEAAQLVDLRSEEHTSELQSRFDLVCRLLLEK